MNLGVTIGGYALAAILGFFLMQAKESIGEEREACNTRITAAANKAEQSAREATERAYAARLAEMDARVQDGIEALRVANLARLNAEDDVVAATDTIQRLTEEAANADTLPEKCLRVAVPDAVLDSLRN